MLICVPILGKSTLAVFHVSLQGDLRGIIFFLGNSGESFQKRLQVPCSRRSTVFQVFLVLNWPFDH